MANFSTVADVVRQQNAGQPLLLSLANSGRYAFSINAAPAVLSVPSPLALSNDGGASPVGNASAQAIPFTIKAAGLFSSTARGQQVQFDVLLGTSLTGAVELASSGLQTIPLGAGAYQSNWCLIIEAMWDAASQKLRGIYRGWVDGSAVAQSGIALSSPASLANLQFICSALIPGTVNVTSFQLTEFSASLE